MRTLDNSLEVAGKTVLLRCDLNVPIKDGVITDDGRIRASLATIKFLVDARAKVVVCSHLGRPEGARDLKYSLRPVATRLSELLDQPVTFAEDCIGTEAIQAIEVLNAGEIALLENLRFHASETSDLSNEREAFAEQLSNHADFFVSDGFGVLHRKQASVFEVARILPSAAGKLVETEVNVLEKLLRSSDEPYTVVLGGAKVSDKLSVIEALLPRVDNLLIGGGMVFTFLAALGHKVGASLLEESQVDTVRGYLAQAEGLGVRILLPSDIVVAESFASDARNVVAPISSLEETAFGATGIGLDIGPDSASEFASVIESSAICFWNGPMGVFEFPSFSNGTRAVAEALSRVSGLGVVGGGDSAAAVRMLGFQDSDFGHISTGGGASLEYLEGKSLPGLEVLS